MFEIGNGVKGAPAGTVGDSLRSFLYRSVTDPRHMSTKELNRAVSYLLLTHNIRVSTYEALMSVVKKGERNVASRSTSGAFTISGGVEFFTIEEAKKVVYHLCHDTYLSKYGFENVAELLDTLTTFEYPAWFANNEDAIIKRCPNVLLWDNHLFILCGSGALRSTNYSLYMHDVNKIGKTWFPQTGITVCEGLNPDMVLSLYPKDDEPSIRLREEDGNKKYKLNLTTGELFVSEPRRHVEPGRHLEPGMTPSAISDREWNLLGEMGDEEDEEDLQAQLEEDIRDMEEELEMNLEELSRRIDELLGPTDE